MSRVRITLGGRDVPLERLDAALARYRLTSLADLRRAAGEALKAGPDGGAALRYREPPGPHQSNAPAADEATLSRVECLVILAAAESDYLDTADVAAMVGVQTATLRQYRARGDFPEPDRVDGRTPLWHRSTVETWQASRPGQDWRRKRR